MFIYQDIWFIINISIIESKIYRYNLEVAAKITANILSTIKFCLLISLIWLNIYYLLKLYYWEIIIKVRFCLLLISLNDSTVKLNFKAYFLYLSIKSSQKLKTKLYFHLFLLNIQC